MQKWDHAPKDLKRLQQFIDESTFGSSLQTLLVNKNLINLTLFKIFYQKLIEKSTIPRGYQLLFLDQYKIALHSVNIK